MSENQLAKLLCQKNWFLKMKTSLFISVIDANLVYHKDKDNQKAIQPAGPQSPDGPMLPAGPTSPEAPIAPVGPTKPEWALPHGPAA